MNNGSLTIYIGEKQFVIETKKKIRLISIEIRLDGNQNVHLSTGTETHLIQL
jgi:hypothetical protein